MIIIIIMDHTISACPVLAKQHTSEHDNVCAHLHVTICKERGVKLDKEICVSIYQGL